MNPKFSSALLSLSAALISAFIVALLAGESPLTVFEILARGSFGSMTNIGYTLYYATPLIFTGLSVAWALRAGLFNIGAEGQLTLAGVALAYVGSLPLPGAIAIPLAVLTAIFVAGVWAGLAGILRAYRGVHEVLSTILLNFVAFGIASFFISIVLRNPESQVPETKIITEGFWLPELTWFGGGSPLNVSFFFAIAAAILYGYLDSKSRLGFRQRLVGEAQGLAKQTGTRVNLHLVLAIVMSGGFAGLASINEVLGYMHKTKEGFGAGAGFVGIAVALMGRGKWYGIIFASILFGAIHKGSLDLDIDTDKMSRDFASVLQGLIILFVAAESGITEMIRRRKNA
jgi:general nucleoside transport system permease protein